MRLPRRFRAHIEVAIGPPVPPEQATAASSRSACARCAAISRERRAGAGANACCCSAFPPAQATCARPRRCASPRKKPGSSQQHLDVMDFVSSAFRTLYTDFYLKLVEHHPSAWAMLYRIMDKTPPSAPLARVRRAIERLNTLKLAKAIARVRTRRGHLHAFPAGRAPDARARARPRDEPGLRADHRFRSARHVDRAGHGRLFRRERRSRVSRARTRDRAGAHARDRHSDHARVRRAALARSNARPKRASTRNARRSC